MIKYLSLTFSVVLLLLSAGTAGGYEVVEVKDGATIKGTVSLSGEAPPDEVITVDKNADYCGKELKARKYVIFDSKVKNVVVWIDNIKKGKAIPESTVPVTIKGCRAEPHVGIGFVGGEYLFRNDDEILHTTQLKLGLAYQKKVSRRPLKDGATIYNIALPVKGLQIRKPVKDYHAYTDETGYIQVRSNTHTWIRGYRFIFDHPYAAVTGRDGRFEISEIPPGDYVLKIWHEGFGMQEKRITLKPGEVKELDIRFPVGRTAEGEPSGTPSISLKEKRFNFGEIREGKVVSHDFEFVNTGSGVLKIIDLIPA